MKKFMILAIAMLLVPSLAVSEDGEENYSKHPGFVDLSELEGFKKADKSVEIYIKKPLLSLVAAMSSEEDPELQHFIRNLELIRVEQFEIDKKETENVEQIIQKVSRRVLANNWDKLVRVLGQDEHVEIFIKTSDAKIAGLLVMVLEKNKEAVFVNIVGELDLKLLGKLSKKFNIPTLDMLSTTPEQKPDKDE